MKHYFRVISIFVCASILFCACSSKPKQKTDSSSPSSKAQSVPSPTKKQLTLAYNEQDGLNPYLTQSNLTLQLADLCYEKMVEIAPDMSLEYRAVREISISGLTVTLYPDTRYTFADGSNITAEDLLATLNAARASIVYKNGLSNIEKTELGTDCVIVTLLKPDSLFGYMLALPVIKSIDVQNAKPTESGRYCFETGNLIKNTSYLNTNDELPESFALMQVSGYDDVVSALGVGDISLFATESENSFTSTTTSLQTYYKINNMIFIGLNSYKADSILTSAEGRRAINSLIDRQILADKCYYSRAFPALGAINTFYPCITGKQALQPIANIPEAEALLTGLGYAKNERTGMYEKSKRPLEISLLVFSQGSYKRYAANSIKEQFAQYGITINIVETDNFDIYTQKIASHDFDMYIGEIKMYNNMDLSSFLPGGALSNGLAFSEELIQSYNLMRENASNAEAFERAFAAQMPYIPLLWRCGTMISAKGISTVRPSATNVFYNMAPLSVTPSSSEIS